jgi:hypothetical protein
MMNNFNILEIYSQTLIAYKRKKIHVEADANLLSPLSHLTVEFTRSEN